MGRQPTWGTPGRTDRYVFPRNAFTYVVPALGLALSVVAMLLLFQVGRFRSPLAPGRVMSAHAPIESRCEECHAPRQGASNLRCQRCHDPAGAGRLTNGAHVFFGSRDAKKAAGAPNLACALCHVEHQGRTATLSHVDEAHCFQCHAFRSFSAHPEFAVLREKSMEVPGLKFGHQGHIKEVVKKKGVPPAEACLQCHETGGHDFDTVSFDRHCASCHVRDGSVGTVDPVSEQDVLSPQAMLALGVTGDWLQRTNEFEAGRGKISKTVVRHRDEWVLYNARKLRREVDPDGYEAERGALLARISQLQRRLALATPLAALDRDALRAREASLGAELRGLDGRIRGQEAAVDPAEGLSRLGEVLAAASAAGEAAAKGDAALLQGQAQSFRRTSATPPSALPEEDFEARRSELLAVLDAVEKADPSLKRRAEDLRRRLVALTHGEPGIEILTRVRAQRYADLERVRDELTLREAGVPPPRTVLLTGAARSIQKLLDETRAQLQRISEGPPAAAHATAEERERKKESLEVLTAACVKCHALQQGSLARVVAARPVLVRSSFIHKPHLLQADCARCHAGVDKSRISQDINFKGVQNCRECHRPQGSFEDCQSCHNYHPPAGP